MLILVLGCLTIFAPSGSATSPKPVFISQVKVSGITTVSATISWTSAGEADSQVNFGLTPARGTLTTLDPALVRLHSQTLSGLTPNTVYYFTVVSRTAAGDVWTSGNLTFSTLVNIVTGTISNVNTSGVTNSSATINWTTSVAANSLVQFGTTASYGLSTQLIPRLVTQHSVTLSSLRPGTLYHFRVKSASGENLGISDDFTFTTLNAEVDTIFGLITTSAIGSTSATIVWVTAIPASSQVDYGPGPGYGSSTTLDPALVASHSQTLTGLSPNTLYHYRVRSSDANGERSISADYTFATTPISFFYPEISLDTDTYTGIALTNLDQNAAQLTFTASTAAGALIQGSGLTNPSVETLGARSQLPAIQDQVFGTGISHMWPLGSAEIDSSTGGLAGFFLTFNSALTFMDGAAVTATPLKQLILPETGGQDYNTLFLTNASGTDASVTVGLVDVNGSVRSSLQTIIPAYGTYSGDLLTAIFAGVDAVPSDYILVNSSQGLVSYEFFGNVSKDVAVLAGQDAGAAATSLYSPQYVVGGPWSSTISIVNLDSAQGTVTLRWFGDDGSQIGTTQTLPIAANGKAYISDQAFFQDSAAMPGQVTQGYVVVASSGIHISGSVVFSEPVQGTFSSALPLVSTLGRSQVLSHVASNGTYYTGLAVLNPNSTNAQVKIELYAPDGTLSMSATQTVAPGQRISRLLTELFPDLVGQDWHAGYVKLTADVGVACFGVFGTQNLSVLSAIPAQIIQ